MAAALPGASNSLNESHVLQLTSLVFKKKLEFILRRSLFFNMMLLPFKTERNCNLMLWRDLRSKRKAKVVM